MPTNVKRSTYIDFIVENSDRKSPKFKVGDNVPNLSEEGF